MKIEYLPHTADVRMLIQAASLPELFSAGLKGMSNILKEGVCNHHFKFNNKKTIQVSAADDTNLLIDFLSEVLSQTYANKTIYCKVHILSFTRQTIIADISGIPVNEFDEEIKAVTYHEAHVSKINDKQWETYIIFDI